jgi:hypothetical protein
MGISIFYAWQLDREKKVCRYLIKRAAEQAIRSLRADAAIKLAPAFDLDEAIKGVTGHPHIAATIRKKIKACGVFLADLTHVAEYTTGDGRTKRAQNANVLIELGMAIRAKGFTRLILVMNDAFGAPEDLPFDLKSHSFPITYTLADTSDPATVKAAMNGLSKVIADKLKPMLADIGTALAADSALAQSEVVAKRREAAVERRRVFEEGVNRGEFYPFVPDSPMMTVTLVPLKPPDDQIDLARNEKLIRLELCPFRAGSRDYTYFADALVTHNVTRRDPDGGCASSSASAIHLDGTVHSAAVLMADRQSVAEGAASLDFARVEREMIMMVAQYIRLLRRLGVDGPLMFGMSLLRLGKLFMHAGWADSDGGRAIPGGEFRPEMVELPRTLDGTSNPVTAAAMRPILDRLWRSANYPRDLT